MHSNFPNFIAKSPATRQILDTVSKLSRFNTTVLIQGESGTGKELVAKALHQTSSANNAPFVAINCGAISEGLLESELFGHVKGSFTDAVKDKKGLFEEANKGTIFLDEIAELPLTLQVKLLRVLQEREIRKVGDEKIIPIDVRVIAATHKDLQSLVTQGKFREDLLYRLNVVTISIPPLRERQEDIKALAEFFLQRSCKKNNFSCKELSHKAIEAMMNYPWPGNIRELENVIERLVVFSEKDKINLEDLPETFLTKESVKKTAKEPELEPIQITQPKKENLSIKVHTKELEIDLIKKALNVTNQNRTHAAKLLEISHRALLYKIKEYNLL